VDLRGAARESLRITGKSERASTVPVLEIFGIILDLTNAKSQIVFFLSYLVIPKPYITTALAAANSALQL
jgi:hypothetical protein